MLFKYRDEAHRRIFQSQLHAMLRGGEGLAASVARIEAKAEPALRAKVKMALVAGSEPAALVTGLVGAGLFSPEIQLIADAAQAHQLDLEAFLREHLRKEVDFNRVQGAILAPIYRVVFTFVPMFFLFTVIYATYRAVAYPRLLQMMGDYEINFVAPRGWFLVYLASLLLLAALCAFLMCIFLALRFNRTENRRELRFLWLVPGISRLFRKRITWRIFTRCQLLLRAGVGQAAAIEAALKSSGLAPRRQGEAAMFPGSSLLDAAAVEAANLGSSLDTLGAQLEDSVELLERELPNAAEATARVLYYVGYLVMALMVCAMLVQMYAPYFQFHEMFLQEGL